MATAAAEEPDLFNGLEITDMQEINMDNGDEYVLIPSDNENDDDAVVTESGAVTVVSSKEHISGGEAMDLLAGVDLDTLLDKAVSEKTELRIVKSINLAPVQQGCGGAVGNGGDIDGGSSRDHGMFTMSYHFNLDTQELFNVGSDEPQHRQEVEQEEEEEEEEEEMGCGITIKEEIDIEETVVNFPDDEDDLGAELELSDVGHVSEEIAISESEDEEDCVLLSLIEHQQHVPIKEERPEEDKSPVENDHAYTSQSLDEPTAVPSCVTLDSIVELSQRLLEQAGEDREKRLASIASIEEQVKLLKEKALSEEPHAPKSPEPEPEPAIESAEVNEVDNLSVILSENCSEPFEGRSMTDLLATASEESVAGRLDAVLEEQEEQQEIEIETNLSKVMSPNRSEPLEHEGGDGVADPPPMECDVAEDPPPPTPVPEDPEQDQDEVAPMETEEGDQAAEDQVEPVQEETPKESETEVQPKEPAIPEKEEPTKKSLEIASVDDLIEHGELFFQQCDLIVDKAGDDSCDKLKQFLAKLTLNVRKLTEKLGSTATADASVQTEKVKLTREKAISLNEKYKRRMLSSLGDVEAVYSDATASSDDGGGGGGGAGSEGAPSSAGEEEDDDEAFARRQDRRKSRRMERKLAQGGEEGEEEDEQDITMPGKKRNARRLDSTDSAKNEEEEDASEPDLSQFLVPKSPTIASSSEPAPGSDDIPVKNEPYSEENSSDTPVAQKRIIRTSSVEYAATNREGESSSPSDGQRMDVDGEDSTSKSTAPKQEEDSKDATSAEQDNEQSDSELLDDVLPQVDDILLDVDDILPAAEGVVQDYLVEEEVRTEERKTEAPSKTAENKPKKSTGKKIDSEEEAEEESEDEAAKGKALEDMTESELEEYYDNLREKEIDKLCNLTNLEVSRNANPQKPQDAAVKKKLPPPVVNKKKDRDDLYDILKDNAELHGSGDDSDSASEVVETEELYLQQCNQNMKNQLLNQLSSSDTELDSGVSDEDGVVEALRRGGEDSDDSAGSILMEKFLKSLNKEHGEGEDEEEGSGNEGEKQEVEEGSKSAVEEDADKTKESEVEEDGSAMEKDNEDAIERMKNSLKKSEQKTTSEETKSSTKKDGGSASKTTAVDPLDKQLFSKKMFRDVDETLRRDRDREAFGRENGSATSRSERVVSEDSDVELLDVSMFQPKRKLKEKTLEDFDFSATTKRATPQLKRKDTKEDDCISLSSESEAEVEETNEADEKENKKGRIRTMLTQDQLADETKTAQKDEVVRVAQLKKKNEQLTKFMETFKPGPDESKMVLDYDAKRKQAICVHPHIEKLLKPHQREGVRFMYDNSYGSVNYINKHPGSGCILAHCMGLGKTLQLITLLHTVMRYPQLKTRRVLVICPKSTVMNWSDEIQHWLGSLKSGPRLKVFYFPDNADVNDKLKVLGDWYASNENRCGCMLIGYEAFRVLVNYEKRKRTPSNFLAAKAAFVKKRVDEYLLDPGADLVICDEGHQIKNKKSAISGAVSQIKTKRRIVLTGTPIQNNLKEYYCMVNFIKPSFLGSDREFNNLYANPIKNGQHKDSDSRAIKIMKQRSFVLHNKLSKFVQRREAGVLKEFLPEKFEYVLFVPLTPVQEKMYEVFLQMNEYTTATGEAVSEGARGKKFKLLADYTSLRKIWTHPKVLEKAWETAVQEKNKRDARFRLTASPDSDDDRPDDYNDISSGALSVTNDWWRKHLGVNDLESLYPSNKLRIMFEILKQCHERGEKCLIFSAFVAVLNVVEHFMTKIHNQQNDPAADVYGYGSFRGPWEPGKDYYRLDGKTQKNIRHKMITSFNDPSNKRTKCFLISAKAGGQGINLIGANRVIILDTSWNPSNDQQNIFRIFRLGQKRKCYVYRLLAMGTMEEKVYSRSVTKQAMSFRVVDEQQIDRHYSFSELAELYSLSRVEDQVRETPILPADDVLAYLLRNLPKSAFKYHVHDSLLENKPEQDLSEEEKNEAWAAYEREIQNNEKPSYLGNLGMMQNFMGAAGAFPGASGSGLGPYSAINYPGLPGALADMYRNDFRYSSSMNQLMYPYANASFPSLMSDPSYSSIMGKQPAYGNFNLPGASPSASGIPDFALSAALNGQSSSGGGPGTSSYNTNVALQSLLELYSKSLSSSMSNSTTVTTATATSVSPSTTTSPYSALSALKQFNGFGPPPMHHPGSPAPQSHSSPAPPPASSSQSPSSSGNAALINMLNEQPMPMSSAASSGPFSHLSTPLPAPTITPLPSRSTPSAATTVTTMATSTPVLSSASPSTASKGVIATAPPPPAQLPLPPLNIPKPTLSSSSSVAKSNDPKPVPLTTTIVASDDDDVDDDGIPRPHIIVRDPSSINATSAKPGAQDKDKVVKKNLNMGIVYPAEKKKDNTKDIMLSAKSITTLTKPTIAVKNVDSMKSSKGSANSPVHIAPRPSPKQNRPPPYSLPRASPSNTRPQHPPLIRTPLTIGGSSSIIAKPQPATASNSTTPRQQQVPVITNAKSLQLQNSPSSSPFSLQQKISNPPPTASSSNAASPTLPRGSIAAQQLRELQQRMNSAGTSSNLINTNTNSHLGMAKAKKQLQLAQRQQQQQQQSPSRHVPVGIFPSQATTTTTATSIGNQQLPKALASTSPGAARLTMTGSKPASQTNMSPLSDSVSITKITSTGQRIAISNPPSSTVAATSGAGTNNAAAMSFLSGNLGRKQDLVITKTIGGGGAGTAVRKVLPGPNMVVKTSQDVTMGPSLKRPFSTLTPTAMKSTLGQSPLSSAAAPPPSLSMATVSAAGGTTMRAGPVTPNSITVRKRKAPVPGSGADQPSPTLIDSLKAKNNSITISEVRSIYSPPSAKKPTPSIQPQKRLGSGITITPRKPTAATQQQPQNVLEVVEIE